MRLPPSILRRVHRAQSGRLPCYSRFCELHQNWEGKLSVTWTNFKPSAPRRSLRFSPRRASSRAHFCLANQYTDQSLAGRPLRGSR